MIKKAQEEMVGFALIMIIVAVILLIFLSFSLRRSDTEIVESYEVEGFIQSFLQYTTDCRDNLGYLSVQDLIFDCRSNEICLDERDTCDVLNSTLNSIAEESWKVNENTPIKGYELNIIVDEEAMLLIEKGNSTSNSKGSVQDFARKGNDYSIYFNVYY